jgi:hypothetical protein
MTRAARLLILTTLITLLLPDIVSAAVLLKKKINRRFPDGRCPVDVAEADKWVTTTGAVRITFEFTQGANLDPLDFHLDDVTIIEVTEFTALKFVDPDSPPCVGFFLDPADLVNNAAVPLYEPFDPLIANCPWDEASGGTIVNGVVEMAEPGGGVSSTSVLFGGLDTNTEYMVWGLWSASNFAETIDCADALSACIEVTVEEVDSSCSLPVEDSTWGKVKALFTD